MLEVGRRLLYARSLVLAVVISLTCFIAVPHLTASAQPNLVVTSNLDFPKLAGSNAACASMAPGNPCTLRAAVQTVNGGFVTAAEITFSPGNFIVTLDPLLGPITVSASMSITGESASDTVIDGNQETGVMQVTSAATVRVSRLSIQHGRSATVGGISNAGSLMLDDVTVRSNQANTGGGIVTSGALSIHGGTVTSNVAITSGGGIQVAENASLVASSTRITGNQTPGHGGGVLNSGTAALTGVTVSGNTAGLIGGGLALGPFNVPSVTTITSSAISTNSGDIGGGIGVLSSTLTINSSTVAGNLAVSAAGLYALESSVELTNDTLTQNTATSGGGGGILQTRSIAPVNPGPVAQLWRSAMNAVEAGKELLSRAPHPVGSGPRAFAPLAPNNITLTSSTVAGNIAGIAGGGIANVPFGTSVTVHDTIVALNRAPTDPNCNGGIMSAGYNIEDHSDCAFTGTGDQRNTDPRLAAPAGTPLLMLAPLFGSPAIDAADPACPPPATDELGTRRPLGSRCDIGAVEVSPSAAPLPAPPTTGRR